MCTSVPVHHEQTVRGRVAWPWREAFDTLPRITVLPVAVAAVDPWA